MMSGLYVTNNSFLPTPIAQKKEKTMGFAMQKEKMNQKLDSLFSMAMYDVTGSTQTNSPATNKHPSQFYPVEEYKDLSLREILDLSGDCLFSDDEEDSEPTAAAAAIPAGVPSAPVSALPPPPPLAPPPVLPTPVVSSSGPSTPSMSEEDLEWSQLEDPPIIASSTEDIPVAAALVGSMDAAPVPLVVPSCNVNNKKRSQDVMLQVSVNNEADDEEADADAERRFRPYQTGQWTEKFGELRKYRKENGHCLVPHTYKQNLPLARWVKRQRYQYKLMQEGKASTMTEERVKALEDIDFVWDSQGAAWGERLSELRQYRNSFSHCNVPSNYSENPQLATWVKCQRRQYKLHMEGKASNMTHQRIRELELLGFEWELRTYKKQRVA